MYLTIYLSVYLSIYLSIYQCIYLSIDRSVDWSNNDAIRNNYDLKFHVYTVTRYIFDYWYRKNKNKKHNAGYSLPSEALSISLLEFKTPWSSSWKLLYRPKPKQIVIVKWWVLYAAQYIAEYWHIDHRTTNIKTINQSIVSLPSLYWIFLKF